MALIDDARKIADKYIGGESENFLNRQCRGHLKVDPTYLNRGHIPELARWVGISAGLILPQNQADAFKQEILDLA